MPGMLCAKFPKIDGIRIFILIRRQTHPGKCISDTVRFLTGILLNILTRSSSAYRPVRRKAWARPRGLPWRSPGKPWKMPELHLTGCEAVGQGFLSVQGMSMERSKSDTCDQIPILPPAQTHPLQRAGLHTNLDCRDPLLWCLRPAPRQWWRCIRHASLCLLRRAVWPLSAVCICT